MQANRTTAACAAVACAVGALCDQFSDSPTMSKHIFCTSFALSSYRLSFGYSVLNHQRNVLKTKTRVLHKMQLERTPALSLGLRWSSFCAVTSPNEEEALAAFAEKAITGVENCTTDLRKIGRWTRTYLKQSAKMKFLVVDFKKFSLFEEFSEYSSYFLIRKQEQMTSSGIEYKCLWRLESVKLKLKSPRSQHFVLIRRLEFYSEANRFSHYQSSNLQSSSCQKIC